MRYRRRSSHYRRRKQNTVWQPLTINKRFENIPSGGPTSKLLSVMTPGVDTSGTVDPFDDQHVLERMRGQCLHDLEDSNSGQGYIVSVNMAAFKVPIQVAKNIGDADMPDLFKSGEGEDYPWFMSCICGDGANAPYKNLDDVDNRAKRKFDVGDALVFSVSYYNFHTTTSMDLALTLNLRLLWKLLT